MSDDTTITAYVGVALAVGATILSVINHKRVRSNCCGRPIVISLDVENTSPQPTTTTNPMIRV